jgi:NAD(P)-dependent dehydrogenase (short-subunit alcohol dehydrogenase family)
MASKIYLECRNPARAAAVKLDLESETCKKIFDAVLLDTTDLQSMWKAVDTAYPIDALVMNADGNFVITPMSDGVSLSYAVNMLGHVVLIRYLCTHRGCAWSSRDGFPTDQVEVVFFGRVQDCC